MATIDFTNVPSDQIGSEMERQLGKFGRSSGDWTKRRVINWLGDRGIELRRSALKAWCWKAGWLWLVIEGNDTDTNYDVNTEPGHAASVRTHRGDGSAILCFEIEDELPVESKEVPEDIRVQLKHRRR